MELLQLHYFCTVARYHSMSRAAEELWLSQPALSKSINNLEEELGVKLFDRAGRRIMLNKAGEYFYQNISHVLLQVKDATKQVQDQFDRSANEVRLLLSAANYIYNWIGGCYHQQYPDNKLFIRVVYDPDPYELSQSDFYLFATPKKYDAIHCLPLMEEPLMLAMSRDHPLADREQIRLEDTKDYLYQCLQPEENLRENMLHYCAQAGFVPKIGFCSNDAYTFFDALSNQQYITFLPGLTAPPSSLKNIVFKPIAEPNCTRTLCIGWDKSRYMPPCNQQFLEFCKSFFQEENLLELIRQDLAGK